MNRVFVGIPTINRPLLVRETLDSVRAQSFEQIRVVVSDNRSAPEAAASVRRYVESLDDPRIEFVVQPSNAGEYGQGRYFFSRSLDCEYFMILHDDDVLRPTYLDRAVGVLDRRPDLDAFVADPFVMDEAGRVSDTETTRYLAAHGRRSARTGPIDVLAKYLMHGFLPISGTLFRRRALERSGFVDATEVGNFPFECDLFLRLGHTGAAAWYERETLLGFRFHRSSMRNYMQLMRNRQVVARMLALFSQYRYAGSMERRRRAIVSRLHRAMAFIDLRAGDTTRARASLRAALEANPLSVRALASAPFVLFTPGLCARLLPGTPETREAPDYAPARGES